MSLGTWAEKEFISSLEARLDFRKLAELKLTFVGKKMRKVKAQLVLILASMLSNI